MKKYLPVLFLVVFLVPSIAMASWWNPFTWKIFKKREPAPQVQVINTEKEKTPEEKISELQKQLDELKDENKSVEPIKENNTDKKVEVKKTTNSTKNTEQNKLLEQARIEAELKAKFAEQDALINKQRAEEKARLEELDKQNQLNELKQKEQAKIDLANSLEEQRLKEELVRLNELAEQKRIKDEKLRIINKKIADLNAQYTPNILNCSKNAVLTYQVTACEERVTKDYNLSYNTLMAEFQQVKYSD